MQMLGHNTQLSAYDFVAFYDTVSKEIQFMSNIDGSNKKERE